MQFFDPDQLDAWLAGWVPESARNRLVDTVGNAWKKAEQHGDYSRWFAALSRLPKVSPSMIDLTSDKLRIGTADDLNASQRQQMLAALQSLHPWRKGPFDFFGIHIDTEWRSDWKWNRLKDAITPLAGRHVLDVGCGSGYHGWRMLGDGAEKVVGIDPTLLFAMQFQACQRYISDARLQFWPIGIDELPDGLACFDTVFSMGILYHRRSPIDHLLQLKGLLRPEGELVVETLIVEGGPDCCLMPEARYAKMRNVWFIPSVHMLEIWLKRAGFSDIRVIDISPTSVEEQRSTEWMRFESLSDYLDKSNPALTIEGHPAPVRAILRANI